MVSVIEGFHCNVGVDTCMQNAQNIATVKQNLMFYIVSKLQDALKYLAFNFGTNDSDYDN